MDNKWWGGFNNEWIKEKENTKAVKKEVEAIRNIGETNGEDWFDIMDNKMEVLNKRQEEMRKHQLASIEDAEKTHVSSVAILECNKTVLSEFKAFNKGVTKELQRLGHMIEERKKHDERMQGDLACLRREVRYGIRGDG